MEISTNVPLTAELVAKDICIANRYKSNDVWMNVYDNVCMRWKALGLTSEMIDYGFPEDSILVLTNGEEVEI